MTRAAVTDSHALIWSGQGQSRRLGRRARALFERADRGEAAIYVPTLVLVEVLEGEHRGDYAIRGGADEWLAALFASGAYIPVDLTSDVVLEAQRLYVIPERTDRLIAATARHLGVPLIIRDEAIAAAALVDHIW